VQYECLLIQGKNQGSKGGSKEIEAVNKERVCATCQNDSALLTADSLIVKNFPSEKCTEACHVGITGKYDSLKRT